MKKHHFRYLRIFILALIFLCPLPMAWAADIIVVQSSTILPYQTAFKAFQKNISSLPLRGVKSIQHVQIRQLILDNPATRLSLEREISRHQPALLLAIGSKALKKISDFRDLPIIYLLTPNPGPSLNRHGNITGVEMRLSAASQLQAVRRRMPWVKRIGIVHGQSTKFLQEAERAAAQQDMLLISRQISSPTGMLTGLKNLGPEIDLLWMLPDPTISTSQSLEILFLHAMEKRIPVLSFADKYLKSGAVMATSIDLQAMGKEAGVLARKILAGQPVCELPPVTSPKIHIKVNGTIAAKLGLKNRMKP